MTNIKRRASKLAHISGHILVSIKCENRVMRSARFSVQKTRKYLVAKTLKRLGCVSRDIPLLGQFCASLDLCRRQSDALYLSIRKLIREPSAGASETAAYIEDPLRLLTS
jgi:hypothetical protein